ncbi:alginate lyase family protein [Mucilaginibacter sp. HMF5004]|uniref:alginate lyase family protein n=1 Tax=Mucilaginibacter rivuli TaxID=2857527 RepID=UPI001C5D5265|nr:alginate lyase family protein [Mucilaginibacter rivuli]MBW4889747.1 alginate lyase family protein [Mucilaginibacter rivuli]
MKRKTLQLTMCMMGLFCACSKPSTVQNQTTSKAGLAEKNLTSSFALGSVTTIVHPGMLHSAADFTRMTTNVNAGTQPWLDGWNKLVANGHSSATYVARPVDTIVRGAAASGRAENYILACQDAAAAYQNALRWKIKGDAACGANAVAIMNAWAVKCKYIDGDSNKDLAAGLQGYQWANAAEIMRSYSGWSASSFTAFKNFLLNVYYPVSSDFLARHNNTCGTHYWLNWDMSNLCTVLAIGILCDDISKVNYAIDYYQHSGVGTAYIGRVTSATYSNGMDQGQESGRDQGHATMEVPLFGTFCQMLYNQGQNFFDYNPWSHVNPPLLGVSEYIAAYNINTTNTVPYTTYNNCENSNQTVISSASRGTIRPGWELVYNYYVKVKGKTATYTTQFATAVRPEGGGGDYGTNSGSYDQLGFGTLTFTR